MTQYTVHTRHGWGWVVKGQSYESYPIETAIAAQKFADALNNGLDPTAARKAANVIFRDLRYYEAQP